MTGELHDRRRYQVQHATTYRYQAEVTGSFSRSFLTPRATDQQQLLSHNVEITPGPDVHDVHIDFFGNNSHYIEIHTPHTELCVQKTSVLEVQWPKIDLTAIELSVGQAAELARIKLDPVARTSFLLPSALVELSAPVRQYAARLLWPERNLGEAIAAVHRAIHADFSYSKGATTTRTTLPEVIAAGAGVCQDFAHLAAACFRAHGLPARYVSGYIETFAPPGRPKLAGSDATHAWASVFVPGLGWVDLDPTNDQLVDSRYLVTAWGRDFRDVSPLKGVIFTEGSESTLKVAVDVTRLDD